MIGTVRLLLQTYHYLIVSTAILLAVTIMGFCSLVSGHTMDEAKKALDGEVSEAKITRGYKQTVNLNQQVEHPVSSGN